MFEGQGFLGRLQWGAWDGKMEPTQQIHEEIESVLVQKKGPEVR